MADILASFTGILVTYKVSPRDSISHISFPFVVHTWIIGWYGKSFGMGLWENAISIHTFGVRGPGMGYVEAPSGVSVTVCVSFCLGLEFHERCAGWCQRGKSDDVHLDAITG